MELSGSQTSLRLNRSHSVWNTIFLFLGIMIGSGIFISVKTAAKALPNAGMTIMMWIFCGFYSLLGSFSFAELGTCFPGAGGDFLYLRTLFPKKVGDLVAFLRIWVELLVIRPGSHAAIALTVSKYMIEPFSVLATHKEAITTTIALATTPSTLNSTLSTLATEVVSTTLAPETAGITGRMFAETFLAIFLTVIITFMNAYSLKLTKLFTDVTSIIKVIVLFSLLMIGLVKFCMGNNVGLHWDNSENGMWNFTSWENQSATGMISVLAMASFSGQWSYAGWSDVNYAMEEIVNPSRNYPIAAVVSLSVATLLYSGIVAGYYTVLTHSDIQLGMAATATLFCEHAFNAKDSILIPLIIAICVSISTAGALHGSFFVAGRLFFSGTRCNHLPPIFGGLHKKHRTPIPSLFILCVFSCIYCCIQLVPFKANGSNGIDFLINSTSFVYFLSIAICIILLVVWRCNGRPNVGSVLDKCEVNNSNDNNNSNNTVACDNTRQLLNMNVDENNRNRHSSQQMTLDDVFTLPIFYHCLYATISLTISVFAFANDWFVCSVGLIIVALGVPVYYLFIFNKSEHDSDGTVIPKTGGSFTQAVFKYLNCKPETIPNRRSDNNFTEHSTDELMKSSQ